MKKLPWYVRLVQALGVSPHSVQARDAVRGTSKHGRAKTKPRGWECKRKIRCKMAVASRRRNLYR